MSISRVPARRRRAPIKRVSYAASGSWIGTEYPTINVWNSDGSHFLLLCVDHFILYDSAKGFLRDLPIGAAGEPRWSRSNPTLLYFHDAPGNTLKVLDVASGEVTALFTFSYFAITFGNGEGDLSEDGYLPILGDGRWVSRFEISARSLSFPKQIDGVDSVCLTPENDLLVSKSDGIWLLIVQSGEARQITTANGHKDVMRDPEGREVMVWTNSNDRAPIEGCSNGIVKVDLATGRQTCLLALDWSLAVHISCPERAGFAVVETYGNPDVKWGDRLLKVPLIGSAVISICRHGSSAASYLTQPKATVNREGTRILFSSNMADPANEGYCDVYEVRPGTGKPLTV